MTEIENFVMHITAQKESLIDSIWMFPGLLNADTGQTAWEPSHDGPKAAPKGSLNLFLVWYNSYHSFFLLVQI